jgi:hypothetical protein
MKKLILIFAIALSNFINAQTLKTVKYGDSDAPLVKGLLETLFTDSLTKYKYIQLNSKIADLCITSFKYNPNLENLNMTFYKWINNHIGIYNTDTFDIVYNFTDDREFLYIFYKTDVNHENCLRSIAIRYGDNPSTSRLDPNNNLLSIADSAFNY